MSECRHLILATVIHVRDSHVTYPCCAQCYSKLYADCTQNSWRCNKCGINCRGEELEWRYRLALTITDNKSICNVCVFGRILEPSFGIPASKFAKYYQQLQNGCSDAENILLTSLEQTFIGKCYYFGFKTCSKGKRNKPIELEEIIEFYKLSERKWTQDDHEWKNDSYMDMVAFQMIPAIDSSDVTVADAIRDYINPLLPQILHVTHDTDISHLNCSEICSDNSRVPQGSYSESKLSDSTRYCTESFGQATALLSCDLSNTDLSKSSFVNRNKDLSKSKDLHDTRIDRNLKNLIFDKKNSEIQNHLNFDKPGVNLSCNVSTKNCSVDHNLHCKSNINTIYSLSEQSSSELFSVSLNSNSLLQACDALSNSSVHRNNRRRELINYDQNGLFININEGNNVQSSVNHKLETNRFVQSYDSHRNIKNVEEKSNIPSTDITDKVTKPSVGSDSGMCTLDFEDNFEGNDGSIIQGSPEFYSHEYSDLDKACMIDIDENEDMNELVYMDGINDRICTISQDPGNVSVGNTEGKDIQNMSLYDVRGVNDVGENQFVIYNEGSAKGVYNCSELSPVIDCRSLHGTVPRKLHETMPESEDVDVYLNSSENENIMMQHVKFEDGYSEVDNTKFELVDTGEEIQLKGYDMADSSRGSGFKQISSKYNSADSGHLTGVCSNPKPELQPSSTKKRLPSTVEENYDNECTSFYGSKEFHRKGNSLNAMPDTMPESEDIDAYLDEIYIDFEKSLTCKAEIKDNLQNGNEMNVNADQKIISEESAMLNNSNLNSHLSINQNKFSSKEKNKKCQDGNEKAAGVTVVCDTVHDKISQTDIGDDFEHIFDDSFNEMASKMDEDIFELTENQNMSKKEEASENKMIGVKHSSCDNILVIKDSLPIDVPQSIKTVEKEKHQKPGYSLQNASFVDSDISNNFRLNEESCLMNGSVDLFGSSTLSGCSHGTDNLEETRYFEDSESEEINHKQSLYVLNETENLSTYSLGNSQSNEKNLSQNANVLNETGNVSLSCKRQQIKSESVYSNRNVTSAVGKNILCSTRKQKFKSVQFARRLSSFKSVQLIDLQMKIRSSSLPLINELSKKSCLKEITSDNVLTEKRYPLRLKPVENSVSFNSSIDNVFESQDLFTPSPVVKTLGKENIHRTYSNKYLGNNLHSVRISTPKDLLMLNSGNHLTCISPSFCGSEPLFSESCGNSEELNGHESGKFCSLEMKAKLECETERLATVNHNYLKKRIDYDFDSPFLFSQSGDLFENDEYLDVKQDYGINSSSEINSVKTNCENSSGYTNKINSNPAEFSPDLFGSETSELFQTSFSPESASKFPVKRLFHDR